jgi:hypothetical protein
MAVTAKTTVATPRQTKTTIRRRLLLPAMMYILDPIAGRCNIYTHLFFMWLNESAGLSMTQAVIRASLTLSSSAIASLCETAPDFQAAVSVH